LRAAGQRPLELWADVQYEQRLSAIDDRRDFARRAQVGDPPEYAARLDPLDQLTRGRAAVFIQQRVGCMIEVVAGRIAEQQRLQHHRHEQNDATARILEDRERLLAAEDQNAAQRCSHHSSLRVRALARASSAAAANASTAQSLRISGQTLPARNSVWSAST